jgi:anti-sigma B factor antagonist
VVVDPPGIAADVAGDVDSTRRRARDTLPRVDSDTRQVTLDLSNVTFLDSMGLGVILGTKKRLAATGRELELVVASPEIRRIFEITMLDRIFALHASRAEAGVPD